MSRPCTVPSCGRTDTRPYLFGWRCPNHQPPLPTPPPFDTTAAGLRQAAATARKEPRP